MAPPARTTPAVIPLAPVLPPPQLTAGALLCTVSLISSTTARPLAIELPKISLPKLPNIDIPFPKLPDIDLPNFGKKKDNTQSKAGDEGKKSASRSAPPKKRAPTGSVKIRAASNVVGSSGSKIAPALADLKGIVSPKVIIAEQGVWKRYPSRRMPGANMDSWKEIARQMKPKQ